MGTPDFAALILKRLVESGDFEIVGVYTQPDRQAGRGMKIVFSPVKKLAKELGLKVFQPRSFRDSGAVAELASLKPDFLVVASYGLILPKEVLNVAAIAPINVHASILPFYRGAAPIQRAIMEGAEEGSKTGVSIMKIVEELDAGPVYAIEEIPINGATSGQMSVLMAQKGAEALITVLKNLETGLAIPREQDHSQATWAPKLKKSDGLVNWQAPARVVDALIRAVTPWPGAQARLKFREAEKPESLIILSGTISSEQAEEPVGSLRLKGGRLQVACADYWYNLEQVRPAGGKAMSGAAFANGRSKIGKGLCGEALAIQ